MKLDRVQAVLLDLDGVVYLERTLIPGAAAAIRTMRARVFRVGFITNNATATRAAFATRLTALGIPCTRAEVMTASFAAAAFLRRILPRGARVFAFGRHGLGRELRAVGLTPITALTRARCAALRAAHTAPRAVAVSFDHELSWWQLCAAHIALERGARFIACNHDETYPVRGGTFPGTGSLVKLFESSTGRTSVLVGKPSPLIARLLLGEWGIRRRSGLA